jgi:hypothetical protein
VRIRAVQSVHPCREIGLRRLEHDVVVVRHEAVGMTLPAEVAHYVAENGKEPILIAICEKDRKLTVPPCGHVVNR